MEGAAQLLHTHHLSYSWQILIRSGINGDDSLIDPLSRVILGVAAEQSHNYALALQCYQRSAQEGSWHAMRKLAALFVLPFPCSTLFISFSMILTRAMIMPMAMLGGTAHAQLQSCTRNLLKLFWLISLTSGIHLIVKNRSPMSTRMSK